MVSMFDVCIVYMITKALEYIYIYVCVCVCGCGCGCECKSVCYMLAALSPHSVTNCRITE